MDYAYQKSTLRQVLNVTEIISLHYFEFHKNYAFDGERHDFWEIVYVDQGEFVAEADDNGYLLKKGELIFHKPGEFHTVRATGVKACNLMVLSFSSRSAAMHFFEKKIFIVDNRQRELLSAILSEGRAAFRGPLNQTAQKRLRRSKEAPFGAEQMLKLSLEALLISFVRGSASISKHDRLSYSMRDTAEQKLCDELLGYMEEHLAEELSIDILCRVFQISATHLKELFAQKVKSPPIHHLLTLRIREAKRLMREEQHNFTEISELCGFHSIHYFSRTFKKLTGLTPSDYAVSVQARAER